MGKMICHNGGVDAIIKILGKFENHTTVHGSGLVHSSVPHNFFSTKAGDFAGDDDVNEFEQLNFKAVPSGLDSILPGHPAFAGLVKSLVDDIRDTYSRGNVTDQLGTPFSLLAGSIIKGVVENKIPITRPEDDDAMEEKEKEEEEEGLDASGAEAFYF